MVMKKNNIILTVCVAVAMTFSLPSQAQRLIPKQRGIEVVGSVPLIKGEKLFTGDNFGVGISLPVISKRRTTPLLWQSMNSRICRTGVIT